MNSTGTRILIVEDEPGHAEALRRAFESAHSAYSVQMVGTLHAYSEALSAVVPDIVVTDMLLPDGKALELLNVPSEQMPFPIVVMTSYGNEQVAVEAIKAGAIDYVVKSPDTLRDMPRTVDRAMREWNLMQQSNEAQAQLRIHQEELKAVYDGTTVMMYVIDNKRRILSSNRAFQNAMECLPSDAEHKCFGNIIGCINALDDPQGCGCSSDCETCELRIAMVDTLQTGKSHIDVESEVFIKRNGEVCSLVLMGSTALMPSIEGSPRVLVSLHDITERKKAEKATRKIEARFRSYFDMPLIGIAITSVEKKWVEVNDKLTSMMGYSRDEILRMNWAEMTHPDDLALDIEQYDRVLSGQIEQYAIEKRFICKDGNSIWVRLGVGCVRKSDNSVDYIIAVISDISERKQAEDNLRFMSEGHKIAAEVSASFIKALTLEEFNEVVSIALQRLGMLYEVDRSYLFKFDDDCSHMSNTNEWCAPGVESFVPLMQNQATDLLPWWKERMVMRMPVQINEISQLPAEAAAEKKEFMTQGICSLLSVPTIGDQGQLSGFIGFDMLSRTEHWSEDKVAILQIIAGIVGSATQRLNALEALRLSESKVTSILNAIDDVVISTSIKDGSIYYVSPSYSQFFGEVFDTETGITGEHRWLSLVHPDDREQFFEDFNASIALGSYVGEVRICKNNGQVRWMNVHSKIVLDERGEPSRYDSYVSDITERKHAEQKAEQHLKELEQWYRVTLNREGRILELKEEVNKHLIQSGEKPKYNKEE